MMHERPSTNTELLVLEQHTLTRCHAIELLAPKLVLAAEPRSQYTRVWMQLVNLNGKVG